MFGTRDLFSKSKQLNEAADSFFEDDVNQVVDFLKTQATSLTRQSSLEKDAQEAAKKAAKKIVEQIREHSKAYYLQRLYKQAKQLSQIIAYIWCNAEKGEVKGVNARKLRDYFLSPTEESNGGQGGSVEPGGNLKKLLAANPRDNNQNEEAKLLREVFKDYQSNLDLIFPIFDEFELGNKPGYEKLGYLLEVNVNDFFGVLEDVNVNNPSLFKFVIPFPPRPQLGEATVTYSELKEWIANREENKFFADNPYIPTTCC